MIKILANQQLVVSIFTFVNDTFTVRAIYKLHDGTLVPYTSEPIVVGNATLAALSTTNFVVPISPDTELVNLSVTCAAITSRGAAWVRCSVNYVGFFNQIFRTVFSDYVTLGAPVGYPFSPLAKSTDGDGYYIRLAGIANTVGGLANELRWNLTCPNNQKIQLLGFSGEITAPIGVGSVRTPMLTVNSRLFFIGNNFNITDLATKIYISAVPNSANTNNFINFTQGLLDEHISTFNFSNELFLTSAATFNSVDLYISGSALAGDTMGTANAYYKFWVQI